MPPMKSPGKGVCQFDHGDHVGCVGGTGGRSSAGCYINGDKSGFSAGDYADKTERLDDESLTGGNVDGCEVGTCL